MTQRDRYRAHRLVAYEGKPAAKRRYGADFSRVFAAGVLVRALRPPWRLREPLRPRGAPPGREAHADGGRKRTAPRRPRPAYARQKALVDQTSGYFCVGSFFHRIGIFFNRIRKGFFEYFDILLKINM